MSFAIDKQTQDDLNIFGKHRGNAIYNLFNKTQTRGGAQVLEEFFMYPFSDADKINKRSNCIQYFFSSRLAFPFRNEVFDAIEHYLENTDERTQMSAEDNTLQRKLRSYIGQDTGYALLQKGMVAVIDVFNCLHDFLQQVNAVPAPLVWQQEVSEMKALLQDEQLSWMYGEKGNKKIAYDKAAKYDHLLRFVVRDKIKKLLYHIYSMDVYMAVAQVARTHDFSFAHALNAQENTLQIEGMYHPCLPNPVPNSIQADRNSNVIFLTGANMAGKSTFMKTLGITIFLAHIGFPVPARRMTFTVQKGMVTTINLSDNLDMGYSHFYAEVQRLKKVALQVSRTENLVVIFDELFRGTNVKDAYDATVAVTAAFAEKRNCFFVISTHIIEAGELLQQQFDNIRFVYFPAILNGNIPEYTYRLTPGITNDRHGMMIINNENIIEILRNRQQKLKLV